MKIVISIIIALTTFQSFGQIQPQHNVSPTTQNNLTLGNISPFPDPKHLSISKTKHTQWANMASPIRHEGVTIVW